MIREASQTPSRVSARLIAAALVSLLAVAQADAQERRPAAQGGQRSAPRESAPAGKPVLVQSSGDWGVYVASAGREKQCYALAQPKERQPAALKRDPAYLFISSRPAEKVRHEVSIIMGFDVKGDDKSAPEAAVGTDKFALAAQGAHLWIRDAAKGAPLVDAMRKGARLTVKAASLRGNVTTDSYSLSGLAGALDRVQKECP